MECDKLGRKGGLNMKCFRIFLVLAVVFILSGCGRAAPEETIPPETIQICQPQISVESIPTETTVEEVTEPVEPERILPLLENPADTDFVPVRDYLPDVITELKYATADNFTGEVIYSFSDCYLRYGTVVKLSAVAEELKTHGLYLKIWDGFRPVSAQFALWEAYPDPVYVADPNKGFGAHTRGNTVDVTLTDETGREVEMPTGFDSFSALADRNYADCTPEARENALLLQNVMESNGFKGYFGEWWHFSDNNSYDVETVFDPTAISEWTPDCQEFISLRTFPDTAAEVISRIPVGETMTLLGYTEGFALVDYDGFRGYVLLDYIDPVE